MEIFDPISVSVDKNDCQHSYFSFSSAALSISASLPRSTFSIFPSFLIHFLYITPLLPHLLCSSTFLFFFVLFGCIMMLLLSFSFSPLHRLSLALVSGYVISSCCFPFICTAHREVFLTPGRFLTAVEKTENHFTKFPSCFS